MSNPNSNLLTIVATPIGSNNLSFSFHLEEAGVILGQGYEFAWDFGDGNTSEFPTPTHTYITPGDYDVLVDIVEEGDGRGDGDKKASSSTSSKPVRKSTSAKVNASNS